jgi:hypothetical protein
MKKRHIHSQSGRQRTAAAAIEFHIEELVLHGFDMSQRFATGDAFEQELARLLGEHSGWNPANTSVKMARLNGNSFAVNPDAKPSDVGIEIARSVHRAISTPQVVDGAHRLTPARRREAPRQSMSRGQKA